MATRQALTGVCFVGLQKTLSTSNSSAQAKSPCLGGESHPDVTANLPELLRLKWLGMAAKIQQRNQVVNSACVELVRQYTHDGLSCCMLKGQGNLINYPEELREARTPGDIDVWCVPQDPCGLDIAVSDLDGKGAHYEKYHGKQAVIEYVRMLHRIAGTKPHEGVRYHHIDAPSIPVRQALGRLGSGQAPVEVEVHFRPLFLDSPLRNWRLQRWFEENEQFETLSISPLKGEGSIPVPTASFNAVYQLCHIYRHLFDEGIGLRQLMDYYFVLRALHVEQETLSGSPLKGERPDHWQSMAQWAEGMGVAVKSNAEIMHVLGRLGMKRFASAVMWVLQEVLDPSQPSLKGQEPIIWQERWPWMLCEPDEEEGRFLLNEIMMAGNFGKYDDRIKRPSKSPLKGDLFSPQILHAIEKTKHNLRLLTHYPEEVLWEPAFRVYHWIWRRLELWRL